MNRNRAIAIADRAASLSLKLIAAVNVLFLDLLPDRRLALAVGMARAEIPACTGSDMLADLATRRSGAGSQRSASEAAATLNGKGLLWKLEKTGQQPSFLFGTMHMTDPRVTRLTPAAATGVRRMPIRWSSKRPKCSTRPR